MKFKNPLKKKTEEIKLNENLPKIITVWSPKSTGKTTLAKALAVAISKQNRYVCFADFDLLTPSKRLTENISLDKIAKMMIKGEFNSNIAAQSLGRSKKNKHLYFLEGLYDLLELDSLDAVKLLDLLKTINFTKDTIVIDAGREINLQITLMALDAADLILIPVIGSEYYIYQIQRYLYFIEKELKIESNKIKLVLNQFEEGYYTKKEVEGVFEKDVLSVINKDNNFKNMTDLPELTEENVNKLLPIVSNRDMDKHVSINLNQEVGVYGSN